VVPGAKKNAPTIAVAERAADVIRHGRALAEPDVLAEPAVLAASNGAVAQHASA
jgi:hypothetical protein